MTPDRMDLELFGEEGEGGRPRKIGVFERAHGGALYLQEVADMPRETQGRILRVLVEQRGWFDTGRVAELRAAGDDVRQCHGPGRHAGRTCPLVTSGHCRLAEEADVIVPLLPADDEDCAAVLEAHRRRWPGRLAP